MPTPSWEERLTVLQNDTVAGLSFTESAYPASLFMSSHFHERAYFNLVLRGAFTDVCQKRPQTVQASTLIFHPAGELHSDRIHTPARVLRIGLAPRWLERLGEYGYTLDEPSYTREGPLVSLAIQLHQEYQERDASAPLAIEGLMLELLAKACRQHRPISERRLPLWLRQAKAILHDQFSESLTLEGVAQVVGVHPVHLAREFRRQYHCTVGRYLRNLRIERSRHELITSDTPLADIAFAAGYSDQSHFTTAFKRQTGLTPAEYRKIFRAR